MSSTPESPKKSSNSRFIVLGVVGLLLVGLFFVFGVGLQERESTQLGGVNAPDFTLTTFEGDTITLSELRGKPVVINFWASWCVECYKEAELLEQAWQDYRDEVHFLGIDYLDTDKEGLAYMAEYGITYPSGPDVGSDIAEDYMITGVPETFFIDKAGNVYHVQVGPIEAPQLYQLLDTLVLGGNS